MEQNGEFRKKHTQLTQFMTKGTVQWEKQNDFSMSGSGLIGSVYGKTMF